MKLRISTAVLICTLPMAALAADLRKEGELWWNHVEALASNRMEGRLTGSEGYKRAADYVARRFQEAGLKPAGDNGWFQSVGFEAQQIVAEQSRLTLGTAPLQIDEDFELGAGIPQPEAVDAELVFVGYGLPLGEVGYDDFAGQDLKGKIIVRVNGGPDTIPGPLKSHARANDTGKALARAGAIGMITIINPKYADIPWSRIKLLSRQPGMYLSDPKLRDYQGQVFTATFNHDRADKLFAASGHAWSEILELAQADKPLPRFALNQTLHGKIVRKLSHVDSPNIAGRLEGSDAALAKEIVVVSAHLDHLGIGEPIDGDPVYHGAMDNASGVASLIETARLMRETGTHPKRSLIFLAVCGEEKGLLGSRAYAAAPTGTQGGRIVADINMDMYLPLWPLKALTAFGADQSTLGAIAEAATKSAGIILVPDPEPNRNIFVRSDQYSFIRNGVPALDLKFAATSEAERKLGKDWLTRNYHAPSDNAAQPVDREAAAAFDRLLLTITTMTADAPARPEWLGDSFFKRFEKTPS